MTFFDCLADNGLIVAVALLLALVPPFMIIFATHEIRFRRLRLIIDYERVFANPNDVGQGDNPTFEFVKSKYISDVRDKEIIWPKDGKQTLDAKIEALLQNPPGFFRLGSNLKLIAAATCFAILTFLAFLIAGANIACLASNGACGSLFHSLVIVGGLGGDDLARARYAEQILTVMSLAILGGYISALREFLRRMSMFDLTSYTFLKQAAEIFASALVVMFLYRAFPDPLGQVQIATGTPWQVPQSLSFAWLALAPLFGLFPESATRYLFLRSRTIFAWIKSEDNRFVDVTRVTPLDVVDGIDYWIRIRLEQCGIFDVQNLATYNPIMLYIETPYGIYQVFDWIAQAQLCHIVGLEKFLLLREVNIRTIFDLERAIRSRMAADQYDDIYAGILLAPTNSLKLTSTIAETRFLINDNGVASLVDYQAFSLWARNRIAASDGGGSPAMAHMVSWITDDLHVRRLRRLWSDISTSLGPESETLTDDIDR